MVSLVRLSSSNLDEFKKLYEENFKRETYDKDFFEYYTNQSFIPKMFSKKFVKLFMYNGEFIGYIWYELPIDIQVKVFSLYVEDKYIDIINNNIFKKFNEKSLVYESIENSSSNKLLNNLGFKKARPSLIMSLKVDDYKKGDEIENIKFNVQHNSNLLNLLNRYSEQKNNIISVSFQKVDIKNEALLRCEIQNNVFRNIDRVPIEVEDIENDFKQEYYIEDLAIFMKLNNIVVAYGQIIYIRKMYTIVNFGVVDIFRGMGIGKLLLDNLISKAREKNIDELALGVDKNNINAISLYKWIGFKHRYDIARWER
ncbi:GNAT family N-acetyltransferase [Clostridium sp. NSJ-6]|uniref:GNAT family N-acetyltransferase n=1 Tax=Clostridium hominis TaxID=2763036 RepID=A0ABR7DDZ1_9CLOT|nr:GNAT family N-acetyltransferase [Clostridium hominis]MBC5629300.1 GNAT family N-acetyltransferase [Clostridium hominis]MDU2670629.1 GNAT family N-acetyltransferase [Clostridium sp.]